MSNLKVSDITVPGVIDALRRGEWLVPEFQREFVWTNEQVSWLVQSILEAKPIGMVTLWEQPDVDLVKLMRLSIPDADPVSKKSIEVFFGEDVKAPKRYALLDGRQRCSAIAMAFGGFRASNGLYKYAGRYFLDVKQLDARKRVRFFKEPEVKKLGYDQESTCIGQGLFPLASNVKDEAVLSQWMRYLQALTKHENYPDGKLPAKEELEKRNVILQQAFEGIVNTKLAVFSVAQKYGLAEICDIFETLNTTGTKVSTVDLIHSILYSETAAAGSPFLLRDWIDDLGQRDGAIGWASSDERPELTAQLVTAAHVALVDKPQPRIVADKPEAITSVKSGDLLATPPSHWLAVRQNTEAFAQFIGAAQKVIAGAFFPWTACPYPVSISIYTGLRWHHAFDKPELHEWSIADLDTLYRAFFWRNALTRRYDQGFLTQIGTDLVQLKLILSQRPHFASGSEWAVSASKRLQLLFDDPLPTKNELVERLRNGAAGGALQKALTLPILAAATVDIIDQSSLAYPSAQPVELHHIYPKDWCRSNKVGKIGEILASGDYVNSVANLMPLSRKSNNEWKQTVPGQYLKGKGLAYEPNHRIFESLYIDETSFAHLMAGPDEIREFWDRRADAIADALLKKTTLYYE